MSRIEDLEQRVKDLERNVGSAMSELNLTAVTTRESSANYREGMNNPIKIPNGKMINSAILGHKSSDEYTISEDREYKDGNGIRVYIKDGKFICDVRDEWSESGGEWFCDIELLKYHIENYEAGKRDIDK